VLAHIIVGVKKITLFLFFSHIFDFLHHYLHMSHLHVVHKVPFVAIYLFKCQVKVV
jgi:hypothetical protein